MCTTSFISINTFSDFFFYFYLHFILKMLMHSPLRSHFYLSCLILPMRIIFHTKLRHVTHTQVNTNRREFVYFGGRSFACNSTKWWSNDFLKFFFSTRITIRSVELNSFSVYNCAYTEDSEEQRIISHSWEKWSEHRKTVEKYIDIIALNDIEVKRT